MANPFAGGDPAPQGPKTAEVLASGSVQNGAFGTVSANDGRHPFGGLKHDLWCIFGGLDIDILYNGFLGWVFSINEYEYILYIYLFILYVYLDLYIKYSNII